MQKQWNENPVIGIDLGTTYSVVGLWKPVENRVEIFENELGSRLTPSVVAFTEIITLVGEGATNQAFGNASNTIFESKRLLGRRFNDATVQEDIKLWPFKVVSGKDDRPMIEVISEGQKRQFVAQQISSMILLKMKEIAEDKLGIKVKNAVITVPAYFNDLQRQATKDAGEIAGLNVLRIIREPSAAAMSYALDNGGCSNNNVRKNVLVFDLGGGTFDVSLVRIGKNTFDIKAVTGDTHLGGGDFNNRMVSYFVAEFQKKHKEDISKNFRALGKLRVACEKAKRSLTSTAEVTIEIDSLLRDIDFSSTITRARFEAMNMDLFRKCMELVDKCIEDAEMRKSDINEVVLAGGSSRIPKLQSMLTNLFNGKKISKRANLDEAVACGAAFHAAIISGVDKFNNNDVVVRDVTPLSLGIRLYSEDIGVVVPRNTTYPTRMSSRFATAGDNQTAATFSVYEGEEPKAGHKDNFLLGSFDLHNIPPGPKGKELFDVYFNIDFNGILNVSAQHVGTENKKEITITNNKWGLTQKEKGTMVREVIEQATRVEKANRNVCVIS